MAATSQKRSGTTDLTVGKPLFQILRFALPLVLGTLFQQLYSFADTVIVGRCLGTDALGAVGTTYSLNFLILGFVQGACVGFGIPAAETFGAKDKDDALKYVKPGDRIGFATKFKRLGEKRVMGKALDDRVGCAILMQLLANDYECDFYGVFTVQEEVGCRGGSPAAYASPFAKAAVLWSYDSLTKGDLYHTHQPGAWQIGWKPRQFLIYSLLHSAYMLRHPKQEVRQIKARYHTLAGKLASAFMWL